MNKSLYFGTGVAVITPFTTDLKVVYSDLTSFSDFKWEY